MKKLIMLFIGCLLAHGSLNAMEIDRFPLHTASRNGNIGRVKALLREGADVNQPNNCGETPLKIAFSLGHQGVITTLIDAGAKPMNIFESIETNNIARLKEIIASQSQREIYNCKNSAECNCLYWAAIKGQFEAVKILIDEYDGSELGVGIQDYVNIAGDNDETPLHAAAYSGNWKVVQILIDNGACVDSKTGDYSLSPYSCGNTALHIAAHKGDENSVNALLAAGASIDVQNKRGITPLHNAVRGNRSGTVKILLDANARIDLKAHLEGLDDLYALVLTPLEYAYREKLMAIARLIQDAEPHRKEMRAALGALGQRTGQNSPMRDVPRWMFRDIIFEWLKKVER